MPPRPRIRATSASSTCRARWRARATTPRRRLRRPRRTTAGPRSRKSLRPYPPHGGSPAFAAAPPVCHHAPMTGIQVEGLSKTYRRGLAGERVRALVDVSLTIAPGEAFGIIGPNGAGKTTFLGCLLGFLRPDSGRITIDGHAPDDLAIRAVTGYLPERLVLDRWMNGQQFLAYHHALARLPAAT